MMDLTTSVVNGMVEVRVRSIINDLKDDITKEVTRQVLAQQENDRVREFERSIARAALIRELQDRSVKKLGIKIKDTGDRAKAIRDWFEPKSKLDVKALGLTPKRSKLISFLERRKEYNDTIHVSNAKVEEYIPEIFGVDGGKDSIVRGLWEFVYEKQIPRATPFAPEVDLKAQINDKVTKLLEEASKRSIINSSAKPSRTSIEYVPEVTSLRSVGPTTTFTNEPRPEIIIRESVTRDYEHDHPNAQRVAMPDGNTDTVPRKITGQPVMSLGDNNPPRMRPAPANERTPLLPLHNQHLDTNTRDTSTSFGARSYIKSSKGCQNNKDRSSGVGVFLFCVGLVCYWVYTAEPGGP